MACELLGGGNDSGADNSNYFRALACQTNKWASRSGIQRALTPRPAFWSGPLDGTVANREVRYRHLALR